MTDAITLAGASAQDPQPATKLTGAASSSGSISGSNSGSAGSSSSGSVDEQKLQKAAGEFESILLASMWKSMKQSFGTSESESDPAHGTLDDWGIEIMSGAVGKAGGLGIGKLIISHLEPALKDHAAVAPSSDTPSSSSSTQKQGI